MENPEKNNQPNIEKLISIADELDAIQAVENGGLGVSCVKSVVTHLKAGNLENAKTVCNWDHDKIGNYPKLVEFIKANLFTDGEDHPWSTLERLQQSD